MNEKKFRSQRTHTRLVFHPLRTSCQLVCLTPQSPIVQSVVVKTGAPVYDPNRQLTPTSIMPDVRAVDPDKVFNAGAANQYLSLDHIEWIVDKKPIASVWRVNTDYEIDTSETDTRGTLKLKKNIPSTEKHTLKFRGKFLDWRTGLFYTVESNEIAVTTTDKGEDIISCCVDKPSLVYDPLYDQVLLYEYMSARGLPVTGTRESHLDDKSYEQKVSVLLMEGTKPLQTLPSGVTMELYQKNRRVYAGSADNPEVVSAAYPFIKFDMRLADVQNYEVRFVKGGKILTKTFFSAHTDVTMPDSGQPLRGSDLAVEQKVYTNSLLVNLSDRSVPFPELYYDIQWYTQVREYDSAKNQWVTAAPKAWQRGEQMSVDVKDIGMGKTENDSYFDLFFEVSPHAVSTLLVADDNVTILTDDAGNDLIG